MSAKLIDGVYIDQTKEAVCKKKKIVHFIHGLSMGGAETLVKDYVLGFDKEKYDVSVLCYEHYDSPYEAILRNAGIKVFYVCDDMKLWGKKGIIPKVWNHYQLYFEIRKKLRAMQPDILHTHLTVNTYVWFAHLPKTVKLFHTVHNEPRELWFDGHFLRKIDFKATCQLIQRKNQRMIVLHDKMRHEVNRLFHISNAVVLNNGIRFSVFERAKSKEVVREELQIPRKAFVIGHVGRFSDQKNHAFLLRVFKEIYACDPNAFLLMVGAGEEKKKYQQQLDHSPMKEHYRILSNRSDVADIMQAMDVFVFPSKYEGLGIVLIEAQKSGLPCFSSDAVPDYTKVTNLVTFLSLDQDEKEWAGEVLRMKDDEYRKNFVKQGGEVPASWDMKQVVKRLENIYEGEV